MPSTHFSLLFFHDTPPTELYTLSLHDALPISAPAHRQVPRARARTHRSASNPDRGLEAQRVRDVRRRSEEHTLNSSHITISYAVFCLKKKKKTRTAIKTTNDTHIHNLNHFRFR